MAFKLKHNNTPLDFKANYIRPTTLPLGKSSPIQQSRLGTMFPTLGAAIKPISGAISKGVEKVKEMDAEDWVIPQRMQNMLPLSVRAFGKDLLQNALGYEQEDKKDITERHLSDGEKKALTEARKRAEAAGRDYIDYEDYNTGGDGAGRFDDIGGAGFTSGWGGNQKSEESPGIFGLLKKTFDPNYSLKTTLGGIGFQKNEDGTYKYTDQYDFNDSAEGGMDAYNAEVAEREADGNELTAYQKLRLLAKYKASGPGEGAYVEIDI